MDGIKTSIIGLSVLFVGLTTFLAFEKRPSPPQKKEQEKFNTSFSYNPDLCSKDANKMVYFATGETVFRIPYKDLVSIRGMNNAVRALLPKRQAPNEPEGCPDNPAWGKGFSITYKYNFKLGNSEESQKIQTEFTLVDATTGPYNGAASANKAMFENLKHKYKACNEITPEIIQCRKPDTKVAADFEISAYRVKLKNHKGASEKVIFISCLLREDPVYGRQCGLSYQLQEGLGIFYDFYRAQLPIDEFIEHDQALRKYIADSQVKDYQWGK